MEHNIIIFSGAVEDATGAYAFYKDQQKGLGDRFPDTLANFYKKLKYLVFICFFRKNNPSTRLKNISLQNYL